jgi:hypothetical protein
MFPLGGYDHQEEDHQKLEGTYTEEILEDHQQDHLWDTHISEEDLQEEAHLEEDHQCHFPQHQSYQEVKMTS